MAPRAKGPWGNTEALEMAKSAWNAGILSASEIARDLSNTFGRLFTRNAVVGIAHRAKGFAKKAPPPKRTKTDDRDPMSAEKRKKRGKGNHHIKAEMIIARQAVYAPSSPVDEVLVMKDHDIPQEQRVSILGLTNDTCRWPIGDDAATMTFCGAKPLDGQPYCECHHARAYTHHVRRTAPPIFRTDIF